MRCSEKCEVWSRVCGYFRPVAMWNRGKKQEFKDRKNFGSALRFSGTPPFFPEGGTELKKEVSK